MNIQMLYEICEEIKNTNSTIEKQNLLKKYEDKALFKMVLKFLLDPMIVTGISKKKIDKKVSLVDTSDIKLWEYDIKVLLAYLKEHNTGTDADIHFCHRFLNYDDTLNDFIKSIITKSLKLGIDAKTANKVYGNSFIPTFDVMLGTSIEKCTIPDGTEIFISQKLNGSRCIFYNGDLYTRSGKKYTGCEHIIEELKALNKYFKTEYVYDGELLLKESGLSDSEAFQKGVGIANSNNETKEELKLVIFDILTTGQFENQTCSINYVDRRKQVLDCANVILSHEYQSIETVRMFYRGFDHNKIWEWLDYAEQNDMEGLMINLNKPYQFKRTKDLIKVKKFYTLDLKVIDAIEGDGRLKGTLGALVVDYKGNMVNVGSGFSDEQRKEFWANKDDIIGRVIEVKYKEITKNKDTGLESLQFPVFISLREQGKEVSYD